MALVKQFALAVLILALISPIALAGPNEGGVLVMHATTLEYTSDVEDYTGMSGVRCGQDGPLAPSQQVCPPYDPIGGADPCNPLAANPTSTIAAEVPTVWYVMAAFADDSCPRLKGVTFRIHYDPTKVAITANGESDADVAITVPLNSDEDNSPFPANRSGMGMSFLNARTSRLQEIWWFAGYAYAGVSDATFAVEVAAGNAYFADDSNPRKEDTIQGFGILGLGGTTGSNPEPLPPLPVEAASWGRIKATYRTE